MCLRAAEVVSLIDTRDEVEVAMRLGFRRIREVVAWVGCAHGLNLHDLCALRKTAWVVAVKHPVGLLPIDALAILSSKLPRKCFVRRHLVR